MITILFLNFILVIFGGLASLLPVVTTLPFGIDALLVTASGYAHFVFEVFPPLGIMFSGFMIILGFKMSMLIVRAVPVVGKMVRTH